MEGISIKASEPTGEGLGWLSQDQLREFYERRHEGVEGVEAVAGYVAGIAWDDMERVARPKMWIEREGERLVNLDALQQLVLQGGMSCRPLAPDSKNILNGCIAERETFLSS